MDGVNGPPLGCSTHGRTQNAAYADGNVICQLDHNNDKQGNGGQKIQIFYSPDQGEYLSTVAKSTRKTI